MGARPRPHHGDRGARSSRQGAGCPRCSPRRPTDAIGRDGATITSRRFTRKHCVVRALGSPTGADYRDVWPARANSTKVRAARSRVRPRASRSWSTSGLPATPCFKRAGPAERPRASCPICSGAAAFAGSGSRLVRESAAEARRALRGLHAAARRRDRSRRSGAGAPGGARAVRRHPRHDGGTLTVLQMIPRGPASPGPAQHPPQAVRSRFGQAAATSDVRIWPILPNSPTKPDSECSAAPPGKRQVAAPTWPIAGSDLASPPALDSGP